MRKLIILIFLLPLFVFSQNQIDVKDAEVRRYFIWDNDANRNAATGDSIIAFVSGSDTATMVPLSALGGFWSQTVRHLYPTNVNDSVSIGTITPVHRFTVNGRMSAAYDTTDRDYFLCADSSDGVISLMNADTSNFDLLRAVLSPKSAIDTLDLDFVLADTLGIGLSSPDSLLDVYGGGNFKTDILVGGGVGSWSPTLTWNAVTAAATIVAKESVVNNVVKYTIDIRGTNDSGGALTTLNVTLPYTPRDINSYIAVSALIDEDSKVSYPLTFLGAIIDAEDNADGNRKIYTSGFSIANSADYMILMRGFYEITSK